MLSQLAPIEVSDEETAVVVDRLVLDISKDTFYNRPQFLVVGNIKLWAKLSKCSQVVYEKYSEQEYG